MATVVNGNGFASKLDKATSSQSVFSTKRIQITPSDTRELEPRPREIFVGVTGDVTIINSSGESVLFKAVPAGSYIKQRALKVMATGTTATDMVGIV